MYHIPLNKSILLNRNKMHFTIYVKIQEKFPYIQYVYTICNIYIYTLGYLKKTIQFLIFYMYNFL